MIDFIKMTLHDTGEFHPIGKPVKVVQPSGAKTTSYTKDRYKLYGNGADFQAKLSGDRAYLELSYCPAKILQGHNGIGSNDLIGVVKFAVPAILRHLQIKVSSHLRAKLKKGDYRLLEVHVAELHRMPHDSIAAFCNAFRQSAPDSLQMVPLGKGIGIRLWPNSRDRQVLLYDKVRFFNDKPLKHRGVLLAGIEPHSLTSMGLTISFSDMLEYLRKGVRIECRFKVPFLKRNKLDRGSAWTEEVARNSYLDMLRVIPVRDVPTHSHVESVIQQLTGQGKGLVALWAAERDPLEFATSRATGYRIAKEIASKFGIDITRPFITFPEHVTWSELIAPTSIISPREFRRATGFYFDPARPRYIQREDSPNQNEAVVRPKTCEYIVKGRGYEIS